MLIEINTETMTKPEAEGLAAFLISLVSTAAVVAPAAPPPPASSAPPAPVATVQAPATGVAPPPPSTPGEAADALIAAETARVQAAGGGAPAGETNTHNADGTPKIDKEGLPWDARIHSSNQKQTGKGVWVAKRNLDAATNAQVRAELLSVMAAPPVPMGTTAPPPPQTTAAPAPNPAPPPPQATAAPAPTTAPPPPQATAAPAPAPATAPPAPADFQQQVVPAGESGGNPFTALMMYFVDLQQAGLITPDEMTQHCVSLGLTQLRDFSNRPDLIPALRALLPVIPAA